MQAVSEEGAYVARVRHVDTSGNLSLSTASLSETWEPELIDTDALEPGAATEVYVTTPSSAVTIAAVSFLPDGYSRNTVVATVTFTPSHSGTAQIFFEGRGRYTEAGGTGAEARWSIQQDGGTWDNWKRLSAFVPIDSVELAIPVQTTRRFNVVGEVTYSFSVYACKWAADDTFVIDQMELRAEVIKR
jgi:hypothetical protein